MACIRLRQARTDSELFGWGAETDVGGIGFTARNETRDQIPLGRQIL
jgi:hypothetical protein